MRVGGTDTYRDKAAIMPSLPPFFTISFFISPIHYTERILIEFFEAKTEVLTVTNQIKGNHRVSLLIHPILPFFCASAVFYIVSFSLQGHYEKNGQTDEARTRINGFVGVLDDSTRDILLPLSLEFVFTCSLYATNEKRKKFRPNFLLGNK